MFHTPRRERDGCFSTMPCCCCQDDSSGEGAVVTHIPSRSPHMSTHVNIDPWRRGRRGVECRVVSRRRQGGVPDPHKRWTGKSRCRGGRIIRDNFWNGEEWNGRDRGRGRFGTWCYSRASLFGTADGATVPTGQLLGVAIPPAGGELISAWDWGRRDWGWD